MIQELLLPTHGFLKSSAQAWYWDLVFLRLYHTRTPGWVLKCTVKGVLLYLMGSYYILFTFIYYKYIVLYILNTECRHTVSILSTVLSVSILYTVHRPSTHCMHTVYILCTYCIGTAYRLFMYIHFWLLCALFLMYVFVPQSISMLDMYNVQSTYVYCTQQYTSMLLYVSDSVHKLSHIMSLLDIRMQLLHFQYNLHTIIIYKVAFDMRQTNKLSHIFFFIRCS